MAALDGGRLHPRGSLTAGLDARRPGGYNPRMIQALVFLALSLPVSAAEPARLPPVLPGWDACKWNDPLHQTPKYVIGRMMAALPPSPNGLAALAPAIDRLYPGTSIIDSSGMDKINIPCVGVIDMVVNSGGKEEPDAGDSWSWQVVEDKCEACRPNKCEEVSKSKTCGAAERKKNQSALGSRPGGGSNGGGSSGSTGGAPAGGGAPRNHPDRSAVVAQAKADLEAAGHDLSGPCGAFAIVKLAAFRMGGGAGLLDKPAGNNCEGYATDIIVYPDGKHYDVLVGGGETNGPSWQDAGTVDPSRYRPAVDPGAP